MTFHPAMAQSVKAVRPHLPERPTVCEFGNQRNTATPNKTVSQWYMDEGFTMYTALDLNTQKDAIIIDLNRPVEEQGLRAKYDLVTNNGTSEHIWNQHQVFENAHNLTRLGGVMLHCLPFTPWPNHGFFNYNPIVFRDLAGANRYQILFFWIANRWGDKVIQGGDLDFYQDKKAKELWKALAPLMQKEAVGVFNVVAFKKLHDTPFMMPIQGKYQGDMESDDMRKLYGFGAE